MSVLGSLTVLCHRLRPAQDRSRNSRFRLTVVSVFVSVSFISTPRSSISSLRFRKRTQGHRKPPQIDGLTGRASKMRRAAAGVLKRSAYLIEGAVAGRSARVVAPAVFARCLRRDVRDGGTGGANLRLFSSGSGEAESGALFSEKVFHSVANDTLDMLQEKIEAYGEDLDLDGFDLDYSDGVMTVRLGNLGTYVLNKQTPNRQLWLSSPVSGPARFDWVADENVWVYRRNKAELVSLLEQELSKLLESPITLKK